MQYHVSMRVAPSVKALMTIKDVTKEDAETIRKVWKTVGNRKDARAQIDAILRTHGVEYLGHHKLTGHHIYYANAGDAYAPTVLFAGLRAYVGCWADLVEAGKIKESEC